MSDLISECQIEEITDFIRNVSDEQKT